MRSAFVVRCTSNLDQSVGASPEEASWYVLRSLWYESGPRVLVVFGGGDVLLLDGVSGVSCGCCATVRSASASPSSPSGLLALKPAVGSEVTFGTGGAG